MQICEINEQVKNLKEINLDLEKKLKIQEIQIEKLKSVNTKLLNECSNLKSLKETWLYFLEVIDWVRLVVKQKSCIFVF